MSAAPSPVAAQVPARAAIQSSEEALIQDAAEYARLAGLAPDEALRRLRAQSETVAVTDRLQETYRDRLAGIAIEHSPDYRIVVLLTGTEPVAEQEVRAAGMRVLIVFRTGAPATRERIAQAIADQAGNIRAAFPQARGMGVDPRLGELVLMMSEASTDLAQLPAIDAEVERIAGVPVRIRLLEQPEINFSIEGGAPVEGLDAVTGNRAYCTTGFVVTDGSRNGVVTAAHCPDTLLYHAPDGSRQELPFIGQWGWSYQDVQLNAGPAPQVPVFQAADGVVRPLLAWQRRASTRAGDIVCHRGQRSGYSCAKVELTDFAPPGELCGGPCAPVWVTVAGPSCRRGDSGGPVFTGNTAYGILKGGAYTRSGSCAFYYYMSVDYLPEGWRLLLAGTERRIPPETAPFTEPNAP